MTQEQKKEFEKTIKEINQKQFRLMTGFVNQGKDRTGLDLKFEWEDKSIFDYVDVKFKEIEIYMKDYDKREDNTHRLIGPINDLIKQFNNRKINYCTFFEKYKDFETDLQKASESEKYRVVYEDYEWQYNQSKSIAMSGIGGMGKSHFLWECQERIQTEKLYKSLFIYGKYFKDVKSIPWDNIVDYSKGKEFLLVIDGINEITDIDDRKYVYEKVKLLQQSKFSRIIMSYRTYSLPYLIDGKREEEYIDDLMKNTINFSGVDFDSAMDEIVANFKVDISYFYHLLYSNNAMQIRMLIESKILNDERLFNELRDKSVVSITFIYERYIKSACERLWNNSEFKTYYWNALKHVAKRLYNSNSFYFKKEDVTGKNVVPEKFINDLQNGGYIDSYDGVNYFFKWEQLSNYLIARSFNDDINGKSDEEIVEKFQRKANDFFTLKPFLIAVLADKYKKDFTKFINFVKKIKFKINHNEETLLNLVIKDEKNRKQLQEIIDFDNERRLFSIFGGIPNRIFNCESYFFEQLCSYNLRVIKHDFYFSTGEIIRKLKGNLHNLNGQYFVIDNAREFMQYACLCLLIPDETIIELAEKTIFDLIEIYDYDFSGIINCALEKFPSTLLKRSIYNVICHLSTEKREVYSGHLTAIRDDKSFVNAKVITNYCKGLNLKPFEYVKFSKQNLFYNYRKNYKAIKESFNDLNDLGGAISYIRFNKLFYSLHIENYNDLKLNFKLIDLKKDKVLSFNDRANKFVDRYNNCDCTVDIWTTFFDEQLEELKSSNKLNYEYVNQENLLWGFVCHLKKTFKYYGITDEDLDWYKENRYRQHKLYPDNITMLITICVEEYVGSLMCNYLQDECTVSYWENKIYLGFSPIEYTEEQVSLSTPLQAFNATTKALDDMVIKRLDSQYSKTKNKKWADNILSARRNVKAVLESYQYQGSEWILLSCYITHQTKGNKIRSRNNYSEECIIAYCATDYGINRRLPLDKYKTIEIDSFKGNIRDYSQQESAFCKNLSTFKSNSSNYQETNLVLPPSKIIKFMNLTFDVKKAAWVNDKGDVVILCNNNAYYRYGDGIGGTVYINKKYFDEIKEHLDIYYYAFTERLSYETGTYGNADIHLIVKNDRVTKMCMNTGGRETDDTIFKRKCRDCIIYKNYNDIEEHRAEDLSAIEDILINYI